MEEDSVKKIKETFFTAIGFQSRSMVGPERWGQLLGTLDFCKYSTNVFLTWALWVFFFGVYQCSFGRIHVKFLRSMPFSPGRAKKGRMTPQNKKLQLPTNPKPSPRTRRQQKRNQRTIRRWANRIRKMPVLHIPCYILHWKDTRERCVASILLPTERCWLPVRRTAPFACGMQRISPWRSHFYSCKTSVACDQKISNNKLKHSMDKLRRFHFQGWRNFEVMSSFNFFVSWVHYRSTSTRVGTWSLIIRPAYHWAQTLEHSSWVWAPNMSFASIKFTKVSDVYLLVYYKMILVYVASLEDWWTWYHIFW